MMVAGIGSRKGVSVEDVLAAIETALEAHGLAMTALSSLATAMLKKDEQAIAAAGRTLNLPVIVVDEAALKAASTKALSNSSLSQGLAGTPSVSEASALAVAGEGARLLGPRIVLGPVTCAIAISGDAA
ncbi:MULTISPECIES: cobalamin biosynthesis protein [unclassified Mesorhizobium]|uniref:cobalamin biosynthesis protein n=1 Tax=unclassified Mesorhizobium TaxID=325217 RepID=UPI001128F2D2|nr:MULTISPECIES: cobalamin biosynthesis protein [unclassified Mesorhizobium]MBZ9701400.1 cobalamin biosynthesis protein [Mesorhizobium sp. CO1-1-3]MBZ9948126.1 cobalamin biosynthesis protein [Mesorhizobium sp. BR1-1-11]MBZ9983033.1 cobalamin biosynthesis protein [Mesorhizobium sp. BR-1-1-8]TPJ03083.1 cobalamin biosynthesis protein [Mesorhizobium sp. B2-8-1]TPK37852.1 cobalamin biosynthesis protein [Mesorhizobium sp. B2-5-3]